MKTACDMTGSFVDFNDSKRIGSFAIFSFICDDVVLANADRQLLMIAKSNIQTYNSETGKYTSFSRHIPFIYAHQKHIETVKIIEK